MHRPLMFASQNAETGVQLKIPTRNCEFGQLSIHSEKIQRVALTAAIIHPRLSAATNCKGRLAAVTRKIRQ